jgi:hypothetical protein
MKSKFYVILCMLAVAILPNFASAQQNKSDYKKVVIIKKSNENGKVTETRQEAEGEAAEDLMKSMSPDDIETINVEKDKNGDKNIKIITKSASKSKIVSNDKDGGKTIEITSDNKDGKTIEKYKIIKKDGEGEKVIEWDGTGEMPEEMKKEMGKININKNMDGEKMEITVDVENDDDGGSKEDNKMIIVRRGGKDKMRKEIEWIERDGAGFGPEGRHRNYNFNDENPNNNKASLGVMIDDTDDGVVITDMTDGSAAGAAGLRRGDVLLKINDKYIFTSNGLIDALKPYNPNEAVKVRYIREGKEKSVSVTLKARK